MLSVRRFPLAWTLLVVWLFACNNNGSNSLNPVDQQKKTPKLPSIDDFTLKVPTNAPPAVQAIVQSVNGIFSIGLTYVNMLGNSDPTGGDGTWEWKVTTQGVTVTVKAVYDEGKNTVTWTATVNGTDQSSGTIFNNWTAFSGTSDLEGANGQFTIYDLNSTAVLGEVVWSTSADNQRIVTVTSDETTWKATVNADGSGSLLVLQSSKKVFEANWNADGSGTWAAYDASSGQQTDSGSWTS